MADPNPDGKFGIPGGAEVWAAPDNYWYVVYRAPQTGTPVAWRIENDDDVAKIFGGNEKRPDRTLNADEWKGAGLVLFGNSRQLANLSEHPFDAFAANFETEARVRPWLRDPEILVVLTRSLLEGREPTDAEWAATDWWQKHNATERAWLLESNKDPATTKQKLEDGRMRVREVLLKVGVDGASDALISTLADKMTTGAWSEQYVNSQISKLADPTAAGRLDADLAPALQGAKLNTLVDNTSKVDQLIRTWVGPAIGQGITKEQRQAWAGRLRNNPQAEEEIVAELRRKRLVVMPEYQDENLSYEDIASTWRGVVQAAWGQVVDETDPFFQQIVRLGGSAGTSEQPGGLAGVQQMLRTEGRKRGIGQVVNESLATLGAAFGGTQRRAV
jgi:hypothetical protein